MLLIQDKICFNFFQKILDRLNCNCWIAGGAVRDFYNNNEKISNDIDVFFPNEVEFLKAIESLKGSLFTLTMINSSLGIELYGHKVHLIKKYYFSSPIETIQKFDFTVCSAAIDKSYVYCHDRFFVDNKAHRLEINNLLYPISTLNRIVKYVKKDYCITPECYKQLSKNICTIWSKEEAIANIKNRFNPTDWSKSCNETYSDQEENKEEKVEQPTDNHKLQLQSIGERLHEFIIKEFSIIEQIEAKSW